MSLRDTAAQQRSDPCLRSNCCCGEAITQQRQHPSITRWRCGLQCYQSFIEAKRHAGNLGWEHTRASACN